MKLKICIFWVLCTPLFLNAQDSVKIGFSLAEYFVDRWMYDKNFFEEAANKLGGKVLFEYAGGDVETQIEQSKKLIDAGVKVLVIVATNADECAPIVEYAHLHNTKVIAYDRLIRNCDLDYYVSFDNLKVGSLMARHAITKSPRGNFVLLGGPKSDNNALLLFEGMKKALQPSLNTGSIHIVFEKHLTEWTSIDAFDALQTFLSDTTLTIDAILASNDQIAAGAIMAMDMQGGEWNTIITGQDGITEACQNLVAGKQAMTVYKPVSKLAKISAQLAMIVVGGEMVDNARSSVNNGKIDVPSILLDPIVVTKENLRETIIADGMVKAEDVYR